MRKLKAQGKSLRAIAAVITAEGLPVSHVAVQRILERLGEPADSLGKSNRKKGKPFQIAGSC